MKKIVMKWLPTVIVMVIAIAIWTELEPYYASAKAKIKTTAKGV